ncbi:hypothetical protein [Gilliamella apis]|uniref:Uncharacterized protein n=1 Tax=Gilliamella apis TaxID=1970738 RepID=A0A2V4EA82_9GAMM|nr:hypothetical protein [Gilliamella apis]PXY91383.1 hypothetical protein DKK78_03360 [Gilliamella apis]WLS93631.1 hypothetical protein RAM17_10315 [Gilliamella apis]
MAKFTGTFVQVVEYVYKFDVEANTEEDVRKEIKRYPFSYLNIGCPINEQARVVEEIKFDE